MAMRGRGFDSYDPDEAKRQAAESPNAIDGDQALGGSQTGLGDQLFGKPGSLSERIRLALVAAIPVGFGAGFLDSPVFFPAFGTAFTVALITSVTGDLLARPYRGWSIHGLVSGLTSAALFLVLLFAGLTAILIVMKPGIHGGYAVAATAIFTFLLALPASLLWLLWGLLRRNRAEAEANRPVWRLFLAPLVTIGAVLLLARVGAGL
jgi:hypothetical protein